jgi:hypothetical protein
MAINLWLHYDFPLGGGCPERLKRIINEVLIRPGHLEFPRHGVQQCFVATVRRSHGNTVRRGKGIAEVDSGDIVFG